MPQTFFTQTHMLLLVALAVLVASTVLTAGQQCDSDACQESILALPAQTDVHLDQKALVSFANFTFRVRRPVFTNPGLVVYNDAIHGVSRLLLRNGGKWKTCPDNSMYRRAIPCPAQYSPRIVSFIAVFQLDSHLDLVNPVSSLPYDIDIASAADRGEYQLGPEDPRIFTWGDDVYLVYNAPPSGEHWTEAGQRRMKLQRLFPSVLDPVDLVIPQPNLKEKNWAPIGPNDNNDEEFLFARFIDPHEILSCRRDGACQTVATTNHSVFFERFKKTHLSRALHLGTNVVRINDAYYGGIFHALQGGGFGEHSGQRRYLNIPYLFDAHHPYEIKWVSARPLNLPTEPSARGFVFSTGLSFINDRLVIGYGVNDKSPSYFVDTVQSIFGNMGALVE